MALKASLVIDLAGNIQAKSQKFAGALSSLASRGKAAMQGLRSAVASTGQSLEGLANRYTAALAGAGLAFKGYEALKTSANLDKMLARVAYTADMSREETEKLRLELYNMARETGQPVNDLLGGFNNLVQSGQSFAEALATIKAINPAMAVTGASADVLASGMTVAAQAFKFDLSDLEVARKVLDQMVVAGKLGNAELEDLSAIFARVGNNARSAGLSFEDTLAFIERLSLVEKQPERLATLADSTLRLANNSKYMEKASKVTGVKFYNAKGERRNFFDVLTEMRDKWSKFKSAAEKDKAFAQAFGETDLDTQRGLKILFGIGTVEEAREFAKKIADAQGAVQQGVGAGTDNAVDQVSRLKSALGKAADDFVRPLNEGISKAIKTLLDGYQLSGSDMLLGGGAAALAGIGVLKLAGRGMANMGGKFAANIAKSAGLTGFKLPLPVYVVNNQMSLTREAMLGKEMPAGVAMPGKTANPAKAPALSGIKAGGAVAAVSTGIALLPTLADSSVTLADKAQAVAESAGSLAAGMAGAAAGAKAGALIGAFAGPMGAALGGVIGSVAGGIAGTELGSALVEKSKGWLASAQEWLKGDSSAAQTLRGVSQSIEQSVARLEQTFSQGVGVEVKVEGNATAAITRGQGEVNLRSGVSHSRLLGD